MTYKVVKNFADLQDNNHVYFAGDTFPRKGAKASNERIAELASTANKRREILIEAVKESVKAEKKPKKSNKREK